MTELCGHWMPRAQEPCARMLGHQGNHLTAAAATVARAAHYEANKDRIRQDQLAYYWAHRDGQLVRMQAYRDANPHIREAWIESGKGAEACARSRRRKAEERDDALLEALTRRS